MQTETFVVIGENGAGKGTVCQIMSEILGSLGSVYHQTLSTKLTEILDARGIVRIRPAYADLCAEIYWGSLPDYLARVTTHRLVQTAPRFAILDGERLEVNMYHYAWSLSPRPILIYVTAPRALRHQRLLSRQNGKAGENSLTFEEFAAQDTAWNEVDIPKMGAQAHHRIENIGSYHQLRGQVLEVLRQHVGGLNLPPQPPRLTLLIAGWRNAGKSTFAQILQERFGRLVKTVERPIRLPNCLSTYQFIGQALNVDPWHNYVHLGPAREEELIGRWLAARAWYGRQSITCVEVTSEADLAAFGAFKNPALIYVAAELGRCYLREVDRPDSLTCQSLLEFVQHPDALGRQRIQSLAERADYTIANNQSRADFEVAIDDLLINHLLPRLHCPATI